jgi:dCTP deaminase
MTVLSTDAIRRRLQERDTSKRLVISPLLDEDEQMKRGQASIDVRLGFNFCLMTASLFGSIDEFQGKAPDSKYLRELY